VDEPASQHELLTTRPSAAPAVLGMVVAAALAMQGCTSDDCAGKWGAISISLQGASRSDIGVGATGELSLAGRAVPIACPAVGDGSSVIGSCNGDPVTPRIDISGQGVDVSHVSAVTLTLNAPDGTTLADHATIQLTAARIVQPDGSAEYCERDGQITLMGASP